MIHCNANGRDGEKESPDCESGLSKQTVNPSHLVLLGAANIKLESYVARLTRGIVP
jgi:hypothetical protein